MDQQHIHCIVKDCHYWNQGNKCQANEILVSTDEFGNQQADHIDAAMVQQLTPAAAGSCMSTCCKTYVAKGSKETNADSVKKMY